MDEFYDAEATLGTEEYRVEVYDWEPEWAVDQWDLGKYAGKWYVLLANGCSCWSGEWSVEGGPFDALDDLKEYIVAEWGTQLTDRYGKFMEAWIEAIDAVPSELR